MAEGVLPVDGAVAWTLCIEWTEVTGGIDVADGFGVDEDGVELHGAAGADGVEVELVDDKVKRKLAGLAVLNDEIGLVDEDFVDEDLNAAVAFVDGGGVGTGEVGDVRALGFGRHVDGETANLDAIDDNGSRDELTPSVSVEGEALDLDEGIGHVEVVGVELEAGSVDFKAFDQGDVEAVELDTAVETGAEGFNDFFFEDGAGAVEQNVARYQESNDEDGGDGAQPEKNAMEGAVLGIAGTGICLGLLVHFHQPYLRSRAALAGRLSVRTQFGGFGCPAPARIQDYHATANV